MREREVFELSVHLAKDEASGRWYVAASDIPGLWLEAATATALMDRIAAAAPEMIELNEAEILEACRAKGARIPRRHGSGRRQPVVRPVFDSPLELAYA